MRSRRGYLSYLLAASYLLAVTCGALFHNHGLVSCTPCGDCGHACGHHSTHGLEHQPDADGDGCDHAPPAGQGSSSPCGSDHSHCPVCQFLCEQPVSAEIADVAVSLALSSEVHRAAPVRPATPFVPLWHGRAPPRAA